MYKRALVHLSMFPVVLGVAGMLLVAGVGGGDRAYRLCDHVALQNKTCADPGACINACAAKCRSYESCAQCCQGFGNDPNAYDTCIARCRDVWEPNSVPR